MPGQTQPKNLTIRELPRTERPRERLMDLGAAALSSSELLAILLGAGGAGATAVQLGQAVLSRSDGALRRIVNEPIAALTAVPGVGMARAVCIHAALELGRRMSLEQRDEGLPLVCPRDVVSLFAPRMEDLPVEEFHVVVLNAQNRMERDITVTRGLLNCSLVHPREVFRQAIAERAASIVLVHNHPSGDPVPSQDDRKITAQLVAAGALLDIPVNDHVIIGHRRYTSFAEAGLL